MFSIRMNRPLVAVNKGKAMKCYLTVSVLCLIVSSLSGTHRMSHLAHTFPAVECYGYQITCVYMSQIVCVYKYSGIVLAI